MAWSRSPGQRTGSTWLPDGAYQAITDKIGRVGLEDLIIGPAVAWRIGRGSRRRLYCPPWVAGIGERGVGLWVRALPIPGVRVQLPFAEIAAIGQCAYGMHRTHGAENLDPASLLLAPGDALVSAGWRSRVGRGTCLLAVTSRELGGVQSLGAPHRPWHRVSRTMYVPRDSIEDAAVRSKTLLLRSAGTELRVVLRSRTVAAAASSWLRWVLSGHARVR